jgi:predicted nucleic acid-binding protein
VKSDYSAVLDACVLLPMPLADTLLRMAETPRLYLPKWSDSILAEVSRNLQQKWSKTPEQAARRERVLREHFPEAWVEGYEPLISAMTNDPKDRHVLAAAVSSGSKLIVTYNAKDFPIESLEPWGIERQGPSTFLINLYDLAPGIAARKLSEQAQNIGISLEELLLKLQVNVPGFVAYFCEEQRIDLQG